MALSHVDYTDASTWKQETVIEDMQKYFAGWDFRSELPASCIFETNSMQIDQDN